MPTKRFSAEQIVNKLREADVLLSKGQTIAQACKQIGVTDQTYYRWLNQEYDPSQLESALPNGGWLDAFASLGKESILTTSGSEVNPN